MVNHGPHKRQKIRPAEQTPRYGPTNIPDPSLGGNGYSEDTRRIAVDLYNDVGRNHYLHIRNTTMPSLPHPDTVEEYIQRETDLGRNVRFRHTGNVRADGIHGFPIILLAMYRRAFPKASRYQCIAFLWRTYSSLLPIPRIYSPNDITDAKNRLGLNRKKGSTTAHQAYLFRNLFRRSQYWLMPFPNGIADIRRDDLIDVDECGIKLGTANRRYGKAALCRRVRERGNYGHGVNHTLIMAISGAPTGGRWRRFGVAGTNIITFDDFIRYILASIGPGTPGNRKCFIMDNLNTHHNALILGEIHAAGHRYCF